MKREEGLVLASGKAGARLRLARRTACRQDLGRWRGLHAGGLRGRALAVLRGLDAPDFRGLSRAARLPRAVACPPVLRPGGGRGAAVPAALPAGRAGPGLKPRATSHCPTSEQSGYLHSRRLPSLLYDQFSNFVAKELLSRWSAVHQKSHLGAECPLWVRSRRKSVDWGCVLHP